MERILIVRRIVSSVCVFREVCQEVLIPDLLRSIYRRNRIKCLRQRIKLLNDITLNTGYNTVVINDANVHAVIVTLTFGNVVVSYRTWCDCLPEYSAISNRQLLLIIPVNSSNCIYTSGIDGGVSNRTICFVKEDVIICLESAANRKGSSRIILSVRKSNSGRTNTNSVNSMSPLNIEGGITSVSISINTNNDTFQETSGDSRDGASSGISHNQVCETNSNTITNGNTHASKTVGGNTNSLVCQIIDEAEFQTICPLTRSLGSVVPTGVGLIVLFIIVVVLDFQSSIKSGVVTSVGIVQSCTVSSYNFQNTAIGKERTSTHPVFILGIRANWLTKFLD